MSVGPRYASDSVFEQELRKRLSEEMAASQARVINGNPPDWGRYREEVGVIRGLGVALVICDEIHKALDPERQD